MVETRRCTRYLIDGEWRDPAPGAEMLEVIDPATEAVSGVVAMGGEADVLAAIEAARAAFPAYAATPVSERIELLSAICGVFERRMDEMADAITAEMGAPLKALSRPAQATLGIAHFKTALAVLREYPFETARGTTRIVKEPIGVCSLITPWNWPLNQIACKVAPALAVGCTMVLKPSEFAAFSAQLFAEIMVEAGVPKGVFNMIHGDGARIGPIMSSHPAVDMVSLTGSNRAGISVSQGAAETVKRVSLELGGKSANIICDSADLTAAVKQGVTNMMSNTGQSCNAPSRMFVPRAKLAAAEEIAAAVCAKITVGDPRAPETRMGPIANPRQYQRVVAMIERGIAEGAKLVCGGPGRPDGLAEGLERGFFVKPTVFSEVTDDMAIAREEIFGPVLSILPYDDIDEAVARANDTPYGLSGYVYAGTVEEARGVARRLRTGMVHLNGAGVDIAAPFGGYKASGLGREWGEAGFEEFLETKAIMGSEEVA